MAKILNFGSLNIDYVYSVAHLVRPGETISSTQYNSFCGGKGLNQSIALSRAGAKVYHAGAVGEKDGGLLISALEKSGVHTEYIQKLDCSSGHAIIQIDEEGQNCILLYGGANQSITEDYIDQVLANFCEGDFILIQNEINLVGSIIRKAKLKNMKIVLNPSPMDEKIAELPLELVDYLILNEVEAADICGERDNSKLIDAICLKYPNLAVVLTLGEDGVVYKDRSLSVPLKHGIYDVTVVDTTAAGDTFTGYFFASIVEGRAVEEALRLASVASCTAVTRKGAEPSIPYRDEVEQSKLLPI